MVGLMEPLRVTAHLQQGVVFDSRHGIALDGLLVSGIRSRMAQGGPGSLIDGGLAAESPETWPIPLGTCQRASEPLWHWLATSGHLVDHAGRPASMIPDAHRLLQTIDEVRVRHIAVRQPLHVGGPRGRFRARVTPVLSIPAARIIWHAVGNRDEVLSLITPITSIGARRGSGEGSVLRWEVDPVSVDDPWHFAHTHPDGEPGRPLPEACIASLGRTVTGTAPAGLRPPMFHPAQQHMLVVSSTVEGGNAA